ncbi:MAG: hypothetical protein RR290_02625 [Clostridia bacterium]
MSVLEKIIKIINILIRLPFKVIKKIYRVIRSILRIPSRIINKIKREIANYKKKKYYTEQVYKACDEIKKCNSKDYIVLFNPTWLGVANSTKGLFENNVPLEQVFGNKNIKLIANTIIENDIKAVIFSQLVDGWTEVIKEIKKEKPEIIIKVIWHANNGEVLSDYTWLINKELIKLYDVGLIDAFAFVKKSMTEFYNKVGYKSFYLINNVKSKEESYTYNYTKNKKLKIGIYNASSREIKNIYTQLTAIKLLDNASADIVPSYKGVIDFLDILHLDYTHLEEYIPTEKLMERIKDNDVNVYITFTECSPMFPIESFESGVPCLVGNNNDYFQNTELGNYIIVNREDDAEFIKDKIIECIENREKIMQLYKTWKMQFDIQCIENVKAFIEIN